MNLDAPTLERLALADTGDFAGVLASAGASTSDDVLAVVDAIADWAWDAPVPAGRVAAGCRAVASAAGWDLAAARAAHVEARGALASGDVELARSLLEDARTAFDRLGDAPRSRQMSLGLANVHAVSGRLDLARAELQAIVGVDDDLFADLDDPATRAMRAKARQNLAAIEVMSGSYDLAVTLLREAESVYLDLDMRREWIDAVNNRAVALLGLGRTAEAVRAVEVVLPQLGDDEQRDARAELLETAGRAHLLAGRFTSAIDRFQEALAIDRSTGADERSATVELALADTWSSLRLHHEAVEAYRSVALWAEASGADALRWWAELGVGTALIAGGDATAARSHLEPAFEGFLRHGQLGGAVDAGLALTASMPAGAAREAVLARVAAVGDPVQRPAAQVCIELARHDAGHGIAHLDAAQRLVDALAVPQLQYEVDVRRAAVLVARGEVELALTLLRRAAAVIESTRGGLASERHRRSFLTDRLRAHADLVELLVQLGGPDQLREAFEVAERARSRALLDAMSGVVRRRSDAVDPSTAERLERFSRDLEALYNGLLGDDELRGVPAVRVDLAALESALDPHDAETPDPIGEATVVGLPRLHVAVGAARATLVSYHTAGDRVLAFVVTGTTFEMRVLGVSAPDLRVLGRRLDAQVARFRAGQAFTDRWSDRLVGAVIDVLGELGHAVVEPVLDLLPASGRLVVVPCPELHAVPFAALTVGGTPLVDRFELAVAPSASAWVRCRATRVATGEPLVVAVADERAPEVDAESSAVSAALASSRTIRAGAASRAAVLDALGARTPPSVLHLACHGAFHPGHAMFSALRLGDGWLTAHELAGCRLDGTTGTLSACESGRVSVHAGDEVVGLPRALLMAGCRDVVASAWLAHDHATSALMADFYAALGAGDHPAAALRTAQLTARDRQPHPFYWAAFSVLGAGWHDGSAPDRAGSPTTPGSH